MKHDKEIRSAIQELIIHLLAVLNGGGTLEGSFRVVMISQTAMLVTNLEILRNRVPAPIVSKEPRLSITIEKLHLPDVYCMHVLPLIHLHGLSGTLAEKAKSLWVRRNVELILRKEKGNILFVPTTDEVRRIFIDGRAVEPVAESDYVIVRFADDLSAMVMTPNEAQLKHWSAIFDSCSTGVGFDEMFDILLLARAEGIGGN